MIFCLWKLFPPLAEGMEADDTNDIDRYRLCL